MNPDEIPRLFDCFFATSERVEAAVREHLKRLVERGRFRISLRRDDLRGFIVQAAATRGSQSMAFYRPAGWPSGTIRVGGGFWFGQLAKKLKCKAVSVSVSNEAGSEERTLTRFELLQPGVTDGAQWRERTLQVHLDDSGKWYFSARGEPLPFENLDHYRQRSVKARLTPAITAEYLEALGCPVRSQGFWQPSGDLLVVEEAVAETNPSGDH